MAKISNVIGYGTHADRPAAGAPGALYCESDTGTIVRDNGTSWDTVGTAASLARSIVVMDDDLTLSTANILVIVSAAAADKTLTLPAAAANTGLQVVARDDTLTSGLTFHVAVQEGEAAEFTVPGDYSFFNVLSDGTQWRIYD